MTLQPHAPIKLILCGESGSGKCLARGTPILLHNGSVLPVEQILPGMQLMGPDSFPRNVLAISQGNGRLLKICPIKGERWICNDVHILTLRRRWKNQTEVIDIAADKFLQKTKNQQATWKLFSVGVEWPEKSVFDPYVMGLWLGDGRFERPEIHCPDAEVHQYLLKTDFGKLTAKLFKPSSRCSYIAITGTPKEGNWFTNLINQFNKTGEKRIPQQYLVNSRENRLKLLAGIIDTDGSLSTSNYEIITKYKGLRDDIQSLGRSLGFAVTSTEKYVNYKNEDRWYHRLNIIGDCSEIPVLIKRKKAPKRRTDKNPTSVGFSIAEAGNGEFFGFTLDGDGRFLLENFTVTHNTGSFASLAAAGYKLRLLDLDNNSSILRNLLTKPSAPYVKANPKVLENLESVLTFSEPRGLVGGKLGITKAAVWSAVSAALADWKDGEGANARSFGAITSWDSSSVLVIDTFTRLSQAAMNFHLAMNGRLNQKPILYDFGDGQQLLRYFLEIITSPEVQCNVILSCHIDKTENKSTSQPEEYPMSIGAALGPQIGTYFGTLLKIEKIGSGEKLRRVIRTVPTSALGVKTSIPFDAKPEYDISTGLADYFAAVRG